MPAEWRTVGVALTFVATRNESAVRREATWERGTAMGWFNLFARSDVAAAADPEVTIVDGAPPFDDIVGLPSSAEAPAAPSDSQPAGDIKRRQLALLERYVAAVRTRVR